MRLVLQLLAIALIGMSSLLAEEPVGSVAPQASIRWLQGVPPGPTQVKTPDWQKIAVAFDRVVFDYDRKGEHFPIIWRDTRHRNYPQESFGLQTYFGDVRQQAGAQEGIVAIGSVLGGVLAGLEKRKGSDFVGMTLNFFNRDNGRNVVLNSMNSGNDSFWYDLYPPILFFCLADRYPEDEALGAVVATQAQQVIRAVETLGSDYDVTSFDFLLGRPWRNNRWREPDGAAGLAWLALAAHQRFGDERSLAAARQAYRAFEANSDNPTYEVLGPYGALVAARLAAEHGDVVDIAKVLSWAFEPDSAARRGWGMIYGEWSGWPVHGLVGSASDGGGFAFAMNTFNHAIPLTPLPRYDPRFAREIGKWFLHAANHSWIFYPDALPIELQTGHQWRDPTEGAIPYEAVRREWGGVGPRAMGDPLVHGWAPTDLGVYSGMLAGVFAAVIGSTSDPAILEIDTLATDFFRSRAYPTYLYYNPAETERRFTVNVGKDPVDLYDSVSKRVLSRGVSGSVELELPAGGASVIARVPAGVAWTRVGQRLLAGGVLVDFNLEPEGILLDAYSDRARRVMVPAVARASELGALSEDALGPPIRVRSGLSEVIFRFAWNEEFLLLSASRPDGDGPAKVASGAEAFRADPWGYDGVGLHFDLSNRNRGERYWDVGLRMGFSATTTSDAVRAEVYRKGPGLDAELRASRSISRKHDGSWQIEAQVAWSDLLRLTPEHRRGGWKEGAPPIGFTFGCEPSALLSPSRREAWLSGMRAPAGDDEHSIDLVLQ
jgi:hypothetical protein